MHKQSALCSIAMWAGLTKSACMHKHANKTHAGAGNSHACCWLHAPTHAAAPEHAFPALRHAFQTASGARGNTPESRIQTRRTKRTRHAHNVRPVLLCAMRAACLLTPDWHPNARPHSRSGSLDAIARASGSQYNSRVQSPIPTTPETHTNHWHLRLNAAKSSRLRGWGISPCCTSTLTFSPSIDDILKRCWHL